MTEEPTASADHSEAPARIAFVGLGLIGGSLARALRRDPRASGRPATVAWSPSGSGPREAAAAGVVDDAAPSLAAAVDGADLIVLAGPPLAILARLDGDAGDLRSAAEGGATLTDVASTKTAIVAAADRAGLPFVGGHPMAGLESSGFGAADGSLFEGRPWVVVPGSLARERDVARVEWLARAVGARPVRMAARTHDEAVAAISHLPLVASAALAEAVAGGGGWPVARGLAAGGWASMTRLARGEPDMGAGILATNREAVVTALREYRAALDAWLAALEAGGDAAAFRARLEAARIGLAEGEGDGVGARDG